MKKNLGLLGIGRWGKNIARNFFELGVLNSIYDPCMENVQKHTKGFKNEIRICKDEDEIFSNPDIDKVAIVTRSPHHARLIIKALEAKKDVFVEKPICFDLEEAKLIKTLAKENKKIVMVGHLLHYHPVIIKLKELFEQGIIGDLVSICATRLGLGYIREEENSLWSLGIHDISLIQSITRQKPKSVFALTEKTHGKKEGDIYNCFLNFSDNTKAHIKVNWLNPYKEQRFVIIGTKGLLLFDDVVKWENKLKFFDKYIIEEKDNILFHRSNNFEFIKVKYEEPLKNECKHFLKCCDNRNEPYTNVDESIHVMKIIKSLLITADNHSFLEEPCFQS